MIIYEGSGNCGYKTPAVIDFGFIQPTSVVKNRSITPLHQITSENCKFLKKIGLVLKKKNYVKI